MCRADPTKDVFDSVFFPPNCHWYVDTVVNSRDFRVRDLGSSLALLFTSYVTSEKLLNM